MYYRCMRMYKNDFRRGRDDVIWWGDGDWETNEHYDTTKTYGFLWDTMKQESATLHKAHMTTPDKHNMATTVFHLTNLFTVFFLEKCNLNRMGNLQ